MRDIAAKTAFPRVTAKPGEAPKDFWILRQTLRLLVGDHLQPVFDFAQEEIGRAQVRDRLARDPAFPAEFIQHVEGARATQARPLAAEDQLLGLHEKFDFADAAASQFHVVTGDRDLGMSPDRVDLALHRGNVRDRGIIEILSPNERHEIGEKSLSERLVAGGRPRLDQGRALPVLAKTFVIGIGGGQRDRDRRRTGIWTQPQIDAQDITVAGPLLQQPDKPFRDARKERRGLHRPGDRSTIGIEEDDDIDIARIIEFARAELAERQDDESASLFGVRAIGKPQPVRASGIAQQKAQRHRYEDIGGARQRLGRRDHIENATEISERDEKGGLLLRKSQRAHDRGLAGGLAAGFFESGKARLKAGRWGGLKTSLKPGGVRRREMPEKRRMIGKRQKQGAHDGLIGEALQFRAPGRCQKVAKAGLGARAHRKGAGWCAGAAKAAGPRLSSGGTSLMPPCPAAEEQAAAGAGSRRTGAAGRRITTRRPGSLSSIRKLPLWRRATAAASERPRPEPGREPAFSSRTNRSSTRRRSLSAIPGPRSATMNSILPPLRRAESSTVPVASCAGDCSWPRPAPAASGLPYFNALSTRLATA